MCCRRQRGIRQREARTGGFPDRLKVVLHMAICPCLLKTVLHLWPDLQAMALLQEARCQHRWQIHRDAVYGSRRRTYKLAKSTGRIMRCRRQRGIRQTEAGPECKGACLLCFGSLFIHWLSLCSVSRPPFLFHIGSSPWCRIYFSPVM